MKRKVGEKYLSSCIIQTVKHPTSVMIWSVICGKGMGRLYIVQGIMNQVQYKNVLEQRLLPQLTEWFGPEENKTFMQDGAPCHTAKSIKIFLKDKNIPLLDWPGNSPDLNPIENVWELLKKEVAKENITNKVVLIESIIKHWNHNARLQEMAENCIKSMPKRVQAVIDAKGGLQNIDCN